MIIFILKSNFKNPVENKACQTIKENINHAIVQTDKIITTNLTETLTEKFNQHFEAKIDNEKNN